MLRSGILDGVSKRAVLVATLLALVLAMSGAQVVAGQSAGLPAAKAAALPNYNKIVIVIFENTNRNEIAGNAQAPTFNQFANNGADITDIHGVNGNSFPNYLALFAGSTFGVNNNNCPAPFSRTEDNLAEQLLAKGKTFGSYNEAWTKGQFTNLPCPAIGGFSAKHNPWFFFNGIPQSTFFTGAEFPTTAAGYAALPDVSFYVPDMCNSIHDRILNGSCSIANGDTWLRNHLQGYADWAKANNSLLVTTFDEENKNGNVQPFPLSFHGAGVKQGAVTRRTTHYNLLRTLQDLEGLPCLVESCNTTAFTEAFNDQQPTGPELTQPPAQTSVLNQADSYQLQATGGTGARSYSATGLPSGMSVGQTTGLISGTPTQAGTFNVTATVADSASPPATNSKSFSWTVSTDPGPGPGDPPANFNLSPQTPIGEQSGMGMSKKHSKIVYINDDGGGRTEVYAYDTGTGQRRATLNLSGTTNTQDNDWEALSVGQNGIYVGAIGDNFSSRADLKIYRLPEPATLSDATFTPTTFTLRYPDGAKDAESLLIDPTNEQLYIASKTLSGAGKLYRAPNPLVAGQVNNLTEVTGRAAVPAFASDGAFSPDGKAYIIRAGNLNAANPATVYNAAGQKLADLTLPSQQQGETVTYYNCKWILIGSEKETLVRAVELPAAAVPDPNCQGPQPGEGPALVQPPDQTSTVGQQDSYALQASNGTPPLSYSATGLPAGLSVNAGTGLISGTPTTATTGDGALVTATVRDSANPAKSDSKTFRWKVTTEPSGDGPVVTNPGDQTSKFNKSVFLQVKATGGTGALTFRATGLPAGLNMATSGWITGKAWEVATKTVTVTVTDTAGKSGTATFKWTVTWF